MASLLRVALAAQGVLHGKQLPHEHQGVQLGANLGYGVRNRRLYAVGRLRLVRMAHRDHAGKRDVVDHLDRAGDIGETVAHV